jgi:hypothetical protein
MVWFRSKPMAMNIVFVSTPQTRLVRRVLNFKALASVLVMHDLSDQCSTYVPEVTQMAKVAIRNYIN